MSRRTSIILLAFVVATGARLRAQIVVIDPANLVQTILIAERSAQQYEQLRQEFEVIQRMAQKLGSLDRYRIPAIAITGHDPSRWEYGRPWIQALNTGDPRGTAYFQNALPLQRPSAEDLSRLNATARRTFESQYATMEITDSVALMGAHQVALVRGYSSKLQDAAQSLETDVLSTQSGTHEMTAVLDKIAAGELLGRRQDTATNQLLSHALEQLLARSKRLRDTEAGNMNMQLVMWRDGRAATQAFVEGTGDALRTGRQP
jgi:conjugal transfer/entry exclusion protein